jgi:hypothetical protein
VVFLASDDSRHITGTELFVGAGFAQLEASAVSTLDVRPGAMDSGEPCLIELILSLGSKFKRGRKIKMPTRRIPDSVMNAHMQNIAEQES